MPTLYITEFASIQSSQFAPQMPAAGLPGFGTQSVAIGASSVASSAVNSATQLLRLMADSNCSVQSGTTPTATAASLPLVANVPEYFQVPAGQAFRVAVITRA